MKNGQKSSLYGETSLYSEEIPYSELFSKIHYIEYLLYWKFGVFWSKGFKVTSCQSWRSQKKVCHPAPAPVGQSARVRTPAPSNHSQSLMASNFTTLWSTDSKFLALKNLNPLKTVLKFQEASSVLKMGFALSKWPHLHRAYLVTVREYLSQSV